MSERILPIVTRILYFTTSNTGGSAQITGPEGAMQLHRVDPHGVVMQFAGQQLSIHKDHLPILARYFGAAAELLGVDLNDGWDAESQQGGIR